MDRQQYDELYTEIASILERHDPMGVMPNQIDPELGPLDEYDPETSAILPRLGEASSEEDVLRMAREVFVEWFGEAPSGLEAVAKDIWAVLDRSAEQPG